eukprot:CAMPEP_0114524044 /NCGR_PEP_ID=MMETSP0109-20121206/21629_1 /TAXON_ID=29199 /ORGANISM="Chlorarachnion reptans, Strain CCCM449" /LENGTH=322 /DNA_ID=CAMNT_0001705429 /DNA_START=50 /DNA_END=1018 /DNA_ORIENTATION=-
MSWFTGGKKGAARKLEKALKKLPEMDDEQVQEIIENNPALMTKLSSAMEALMEKDLKLTEKSSSGKKDKNPELDEDLPQTVPGLAKRDERLLKSPPNSKLKHWRPPIEPKNEEVRIQILEELQVLDTAKEENFNQILWIAMKIIGVEIGAVSLVDSKRQFFKSVKGLGSCRETGRDESFCAHAILQPGKLFIVEDTHKDTRFAQNPLVTSGPKIRFYAGMPLTFSRGEERISIGTLCVISSKPNKINKEQKIALRNLGNLTRDALWLRRLKERRISFSSGSILRTIKDVRVDPSTDRKEPSILDFFAAMKLDPNDFDLEDIS